ncbi:hypothetical protein F5146DRAFT_141734 [Armillaria mellea]|nr:hypothetical protein F5146DRAFT_141734 [Armillaria mellea]
MRLQYAKLKVEHGWTKQTLNEVENLYFHHSHIRGPRPVPPNQLLSTSHEPTLVLSDTPSPRPSSLSFRSNISRTSTLIDLDDIEVETTPDASSSLTPPPPPLQPSPFPPDSALQSRPRTQSPSRSPVPTGKTQTKPWPSPTLTPKRQPAKLLSAPDIYGKGQQQAGPVLTYDSFWSKHTSAPHYRSLSSRGSVSDVMNDVG